MEWVINNKDVWLPVVLSIISAIGVVAAAYWAARLKRVDETPRFTYAGLKMLLQNREHEVRYYRMYARILERRVQVAQQEYFAATGVYLEFKDGDEFDELDRMGST